MSQIKEKLTVTLLSKFDVNEMENLKVSCQKGVRICKLLRYQHFDAIYQTRKTVFDHVSKHGEES